MARTPVGRVSGSPRIDTSAMKEPDADTEVARKLWLEEIQDDPDFHEGIGEVVDGWKSTLAQTMDPGKIDIHLVGESHIDVAWLWRYEQTRKKAVVTFRKAVYHARLFPSTYTYALSEPLLLEWVKEDDPALFKDIQDVVKAGRIELVGGSYVEPDCMMPSGEAFVRQRLYGQRFYRDHFGRLADVEWFLDSFGYNWGLPQVLVKSGAKYFWTSKITWNKNTIFPFVNFWWEGPDGSRLLTANFQMGPGPLTSWMFYEVGRRPLLPGGRKVWDYTMDYEDLGDHVEPGETCPVVGYFAGKGDGGHGPTHQEVAEFNAYHASKFMHWSTTGAFFKALEGWSDRFPVWRDELYLENHRGTFSVHAEVKRHNRLFENAIVGTEALATLVAAMSPGYTVPVDVIERAWKITLKAQFHDVLPGSSIPEVYDDAMDDWDETHELLGKVKAGVAGAVARGGPGKALLLFNPVSWARAARVFIPAAGLVGAPGKPPAATLRVLDATGQVIATVPAQPVAAEDPAGIDPRPAGWWAVVTLQPLSLAVATLDAGGYPAPVAEAVKGSDTSLDNGLVSIAIDPATGAMTRMTSPGVNGGKNLLAGDGSNKHHAYLDKSKDWPAWNLTPKYWEHPLDLPASIASCRLVEQGPVFSTVLVEGSLGDSPVSQRLSVFAGLPEVFVDWVADWRRPDAMVKLAYETATGATTVVADIAFGAITRSTVPTTPGDKARYEKICHKYFDLSTPSNDWGLALLNEGKYAFDATGGTMRLTMLRSPAYPAPAGEAFVREERRQRKDRDGTAPPTHSGLGPAKCRFALLPHAGGALVSPDGSANAVVKQKAEEFNQPVIAIPVDGTATEIAKAVTSGAPVLQVKPANVMVSAVKPDEWTASGKIIVRFLETSGVPAAVTAKVVHPALAGRVTGVSAVDFLERPESRPFTWDQATGTLSFTAGKFEGTTFALEVREA